MAGKILAVTFVASLLTAALLVGGRAATATVTDTASVRFAASATPESALEWAAERGLRLEEVRAEYTDGVESEFGGTYVADPAVADVAADYRQEATGAFQDLFAALNEDPDATASDKLLVGRIIQDLAAGQAPVAGAIVTGDPVAIRALLADPTVTEVEIKSDVLLVEAIDEIETQVAGNLDPPPSSTRETGPMSSELAETTSAGGGCQSPWHPTRGRITTRASSNFPLRRFVYQSFVWSAANLDRLKDCHGRITYEAEAWTDNYDRQHYLGSVTYATSSMRKYYRDTEYANPEGDNELGYTMGTSDAKQLRANKIYTTVIRTKHGNADSDRGKTQGARGHRRWPGFCHSRWCIAQDDVARLIPAWEHQIPGSTAWTK